MADLRQRLAAKPDDLPDLGAIRRDVVREIERERLDVERRARQRAKKQRRKERKATAAGWQPALDGPDRV
jgi:hypothetical protein